MTAVCSRCNEQKPLTAMVRDGVVDGKVRYRKYCNECRAKHRNANKQGKEMPWRERLGKIQTRAKQRGIACTVSTEYLEHIWNLQGGLCLYTRESMLTGYGLRNHPQVVSVDRIDPARGYEPGNVVLCTARANAIKQDMTMREFMIWMPLWYLRLKTFQLRSKNAGS